jgi:hypothetical protein
MTNLRVAFCDYADVPGKKKLLLLLLTAIGLSPGGSSPTLVRTKIKIHKTTITTKQLQNKKK